MPTLTKRATVVGNVVSTWTNTPNAVDAGTATFATWAVTTANATGSLDLSGFDFSAIPEGEEVNSVSISVKGYVSNTTRMLAPLAELFVGGTSRGGPQTLAPHQTSTATIYTSFTVSMTLAELKAGDFFVRFTARRGTATQAANTNLDWVEITVDYGAAPLIETFIDDFSTLDMSKYSAQYGFDASSGRAVASISAQEYKWARTDEMYTAPGSAIHVQASGVIGGSGSGGREQIFGLLNGDAITGKGVKFIHTGSALVAARINGSQSVIGSTTVPADAWWRFSFPPGTVVFQWSADGTSWTDFASDPWPHGNLAVRVEFAVGAWQAEGSFSGWFDNINVPLSGPVVGIWNGTRWATPQVWNGARWVPGNEVGVWNGTTWVPLG